MSLARLITALALFTLPLTAQQTTRLAIIEKPYEPLADTPAAPISAITSCTHRTPSSA